MREQGRPRNPGSEDHRVAPDFTDTPAEVDAVFRSQRRAAAAHFLIFCLIIGGAVAAMLSLSWWTNSSALTGLSPAFVVVGGGIYLAFVGIAVSAATLANSVEETMMGAPIDPDEFDE